MEARRDSGDLQLLVRCLEPTLPTNRFYHLLHKQRFAEAMSIARQFGLDAGLVNRVRTTAVLDRADKATDETILGELKACLDDVEDIEFVVDSVLQASLPDVLSVKSALEYGLQRIAQDTSAGGDSMMRSRILGAMKRLATYQMAAPAGQALHPHDWHRFRTVDLLRETVGAITNGRVGTATVIWTRHRVEYSLAEHIPSLLSSIPDWLGSAVFLPWLRDHVFAHTIREHHGFVLDWVARRARSLELTEKAAWPGNSLALIAATSDLLQLHSGTDSAARMLQAEGACPAEFVDRLCGCPDEDSPSVPIDTAGVSAKELIDLRSALQDILALRASYDLQLSLSDFQGESAPSIVSRLLERVVAPELVPGVVSGEVVPFLAAKGLPSDPHLLGYLRDLMGLGSAVSVGVTGSAWEGKAIAVVRCIQGVDCRVEATLELMRRVSVPCSEDIQLLIDEVPQWDHGRQDEFREQRRIMRLKRMLLPYGMSDFNLTDASLARGLMRHILSRVDVPSSLEDALLLVDAYHHLSKREAYVARMRNLCLLGRTGDAEALFASLPGDLVVATGTAFVAWALVVLDDAGSTSPPDQEVRVRAATLAVAVLQALLARRPDELRQDGLDELRDQYSTVRCLLGLMAGFGLHVTPAELAEPAVRKRLLGERLDAALGGADAIRCAADGGVSFAGQGEFFRFAGLLSFTRNEVVTFVARHCSATGRANEAALALHLCRDSEARAPTPEVARIMCEVSYSLARGQAAAPRGRGDSTPPRVRMSDCLGTAARALVFAGRHDICDCLELARACELAAEVGEHCEDGSDMKDGGGPSVAASGFSRRMREGRFREDGLVLDSAEVVPLAAQFVEAAVVFNHRRPWPHEHRRVGGCLFGSGRKEHLVGVSGAAKQIFAHLTQNSLTQVALRYALAAFGACAQHGYTNAADTACQERFNLIAPRASGVVENFSALLLTKVLGAPSVDRRLAMGYIAGLPLKDSFERFRASVSSTKRNYGKLQQVAAVGVGFSTLWREAAFLKECRSLLKNSQWWDRLAGLGVPFDRKQFEGSPGSYVTKLMPAVLARSGSNLSLAKELAAAYGVSADEVTKHYLQLVLSSVAEETEGDVDALAERPGSPLRLATEQACSAEDKPEMMRVLMEECLPTVSPYAYGKLSFVLATVNEVNALATGAGEQPQSEEEKEETARFAECAESWLMLLRVLRRYTREQSASAYENTFMDTLGCGKRAAKKDPLAERRLPFHHLVYGDPWKTLRPEISLSTMSKLLPVARLLSLSTDNFLVEVIEKAVSECGGEGSVTATTFQAMCGVLKRMDDPETSIMAAKLIADGLPLSREKIEALRMGVQMTKAWAQSLAESGAAALTDKVCRMKDRLTALYQRTATELALADAGIDDEAVLSKLGQPPELICNLYELYSCGDKAAALAGRGVSLHELQEGLAARHGLSSEKLRKFLVQKWLVDAEGEATDANESQLNVTVGAGGTAGLSLGGALDDEPAGGGGGAGEDAQASGVDANLRRAIALLRMGDRAETVEYLVNFAFMEQSLKITAVARRRAFVALFNIAPIALICEVSGRTLAELRDHMVGLIYVTRLEQVHVTQTVAEFLACSKEGLVRGLWRNRGHEPKAVRLVTDLCVDYEIYDLALWNNALKQLMASRQHGYLSKLLTAASGVPCLWELASLSSAWKAAVEHFLQAGSQATTPADAERSAMQAFQLIARTPFVLAFDLLSVSVCFHGLRLPHLALGAALLLPEGCERRAGACKRVLTTAEDCLACLDQTRAAGDAMPIAQKVRDHVYVEMNAAGWYAQLLGTSHADGFVKHMVHRNSIDGLLGATLQAGRLEDAARLVQKAHRVHPIAGVDDATSGEGPPHRPPLRQRRPGPPPSRPVARAAPECAVQRWPATPPCP